MSSNAGIIDRQCFRSCDRFSFFDPKISVEKLTGLTLLGETLQPTSNIGTSTFHYNCQVPAPGELSGLNYVSTQDKFRCQICSVDLLDSQAMREHHHNAWHLFNVSRVASKEEPLTLAEYEAMLISPNQMSVNSQCFRDRSAILRSEQEDVLPITASSYRQMIFFRNKCDEIIGINRCLLFNRRTIPVTLDDLLSRVTRVRQSRFWAVLLYSGGKFAGGIFDGPNELVHKTLHHYTVRAKQGAGQSSYDGSNTGMGAAKSAGANLRRHGEMAIRNEISNLLHNRWRSDLQACQFIFLWSPKVHAKIFFIPPSVTLDPTPVAHDPDSHSVSRPTPTLQLPPDPQATPAVHSKMGMTADDTRVFRVPCSTKHITFTQVKDLHRELSTFMVYDGHADLQFLAQSGRKQLQTLNQSGGDTLLETRSGRLIYGPLNKVPFKLYPSLSSSSSSSESDDNVSSSSSALIEEQQLSEAIDKLSTSSSVVRSSSPKLDSTCTPDNEATALNDLYATHHGWHRRVRVAVAAGDYVALRDLLPRPACTQCNNADARVATDLSDSLGFAKLSESPQSPVTNASSPSPEVCVRLLNHRLNEGRTLLHVAVEFQDDTMVLNLLLESGCDPSFHDSHGVSPYILACKMRKKHLCNVFRRFRFFHPNRYNYTEAQIPVPLDPATEAAQAEKERERQRRQRQRAKEKRATERLREQKAKEEEAEKQRFLALSDREKRAVITERRLLALGSGSDGRPLVFSRCYQCACDISGKVPFTYMDFSFCTPSCLKSHRLSLASKP